MNRIKKLDKILNFHSNIIKNNNFSCEKGCASCCTLNVCITSLEAEKILSSIGTGLKQKVEDFINFERFQPKTTTNSIANLAIEDIDPPEEYMPEATKPCPFLEDNECMIYDIRPLSCRIMLSNNDCKKTGGAEIDEMTMSINSVFQQYVELLDHDGVSGNMIDLIVHGSNPVFASKFIENQTPRAIMVPPEHQAQLRGLIEELNKILSA